MMEDGLNLRSIKATNAAREADEQASPLRRPSRPHANGAGYRHPRSHNGIGAAG